MWKHPHLLRDFNYIGLHRYSLTWCCDRRQLTFTQADRVASVREQILRACDAAECEIVADCFMPDHVHQLIRGGTATADGRKFIRLAKQDSAFHFKHAFNRRLWQRYGRDQVIRDDEDIRPIARYIIENPVRAGLVSRQEDYPFIGSQIYSREELIRWAYS